VLKTRRYGGQATLILDAGEGGTFSLLEEWTDKAAPTRGGVERLLAAPALLELVQLVRQLKASAAPAARHPKGVDRCP
jgi:hypothetical protein